MKSAVYFGTRNLYKSMIPAIKSLIYNSNVEKIYLLIEDDIFPFELPPIIETKNMSSQQWFPATGPNFRTQWTYMGLMRAVFPKIFKEDLILSLDVDTIVNQDISELWDFELSPYYFAAAREVVLSKTKKMLYTNSGTTLFNLKKLRADGMDDKLIDALNKKRYMYTTQDCLNELCQGKILELPSDYNVCNFTESPQEEKIIHFANTRREIWSEQEVVLKYKRMSWKEVLNH